MKNLSTSRFLGILIAFSFIGHASGQIINSNPPYPTVNDSAYITFHVDQCGCNLVGYTGNIYAHTGVNTNLGNWQHVKTPVWGTNTPATKLAKINNTTYVLHLTPDIKTYYGIPGTETVTQLALVFRSEDATKQTSDLFYDVYQPGLNLVFIRPKKDTVFKLNDTVAISAKAVVLGTPNPDSVSLYVDDTLKYVSHTNTLDYPLIVTSTGKHWIKVVAGNGIFTSADSIYYFGRTNFYTGPLPAGVADGINYIDSSTVTLVLFAPHKDNVFVIGDFNNWNLSDGYLMNRTPDSSRYWITLINLVKGQEYAFQYLVDGTIRIADPYADKILDPANDASIPTTTYPNLKPYPVGKTTEITSVMQTYQTPYSWEVTDFTPPKITDLVIYEMLIRDFTTAKTFKAAMDTIGYLKRLGVNAIELMPVSEFEGNSSWGYNPDFYFAVDKAYGTKNDYKKFIDECHKQGIAVIMDIVLNHSYGSSPMVRLYYDLSIGKTTTQSPWFNQVCPHQPYCWGYDFNHESPSTKEFVKNVTRYWLKEYKIDGYRFDFTKGFTNKINGPDQGWNYDASRIAILEAMNDSIKAFKNNAILIFEHFTDNSEEKLLSDHGILIWGNLNYNYNQSTMGYSSSSIIDAISYKNRGWNNPTLVGYMESHDEERLMYKNLVYGNASGSYDVKDTVTALHRMEAAACFFLTVPGPKMIWQFGELGYGYSINYDPVSNSINNGNRLAPKPVRWNYYNNPDRRHLYDIFAALAKLRTAEDIFRTASIDMNTLLLLRSIHLNSSGMNLTIIGNFDVTEGNIDAVFQHTGTWYDYFSGTSLQVDTVHTLIDLKPGEYHILTDSLLPMPEITPLYPNINPTAIQEISSNIGETRVYPNPTSGKVTLLPSSEGTLYFELYDLTGKKLYTNTLEVKVNQPYSMNLQDKGVDWQKGMYIYKIVLNNTFSEGKLIFK
jgi:1,4-alpha-glucan branching enzyme